MLWTWFDIHWRGYTRFREGAFVSFWRRSTLQYWSGSTYRTHSLIQLIMHIKLWVSQYQLTLPKAWSVPLCEKYSYWSGISLLSRQPGPIQFVNKVKADRTLEEVEGIAGADDVFSHIASVPSCGGSSVASSQNESFFWSLRGQETPSHWIRFCRRPVINSSWYMYRMCVLHCFILLCCVTR